jgi:hypothetical protein
MPDQYRESTKDSPESSDSFQRSAIEEEILALERQLAEKKAERTIPLEQVINAEGTKPGNTGVQTQITPPIQTDVSADAAKLSGIEKNQQLQGLVQLAFSKGVAHASEVVRNLDSPYLLDEFHDVLIDEFKKALVEQGKLEEI